MADMKEVQVTLSSSELKALTGGKRPRQPRGTRKQRGGAAVAESDASPESGRVQDIGGSLSPMEAAVAEGSVARIEKIDGGDVPVGVQSAISGEARGAPLLVGGGVTAAVASLGTIMDRGAPSPLAAGLTGLPSVTRPSLSGTTVVGGGSAAPIVIGGKRGGSTVSTVPIAKILPNKRRLSGAPAATTHKKPKFKVGGGSEEPQKTNSPPGGLSAPPGAGTTGGARVAGIAAKQTRRFKERKIKLTVKSSRVAKAMRHKVKTRVRAMPIGEVRKLLLQKGIIKAAAAEKLPEEMLRNMLRDYMLLHNAE